MLLRDLIKRCSSNLPNKVAYICGNRQATWQDMEIRSEALAASLQNLGIGKGDAVAMFSQETIEVYDLFFACMKIGAIRVGLNWRYAREELRHVIKDSAAKLIIVQASIAHLAREVLDECIENGIKVVGFGGKHDFSLDFDELIENGNFLTIDYPDISPEDPLFYSYTSGTTGYPKGVVLTHGGLKEVVLHSTLSFGFAPDDIWYMPASSAWVVIALNVLGLSNGMTHVIPEGNFDVKQYLQDVDRFKVTVALFVPTMVPRIIDEFKNNDYNFSSVRMIIFGSSPSSPALIRRMHETWPQCDLLHTYGITEATGGWVTFMTPRDFEVAFHSRPELLKSVGRCGLHFEASIRDELGNELPRGAVGELWLRGASIMKEYLHLPEKTAEVLTPDGWLRCNDIGSMDPEGYIYLHDRKDFLIITGGINVFPASVEAVLISHPAVEEVAVVGVPHPEWGEAVVAVVKTKENESLTQDDLLKICEGRLGKPEMPKFILFVDEPLPKTISAKLRKKEIRNWFLDNPDLVPWEVKGIE